jgi:hypothetical protein
LRMVFLVNLANFNVIWQHNKPIKPKFGKMLL